MDETTPAGEIVEIDVDGRRVVADVHGSGERTLLLLNGGPGLPCDYLRDPHLRLAGPDLRVVAFDQLGCGRSDRPSDPALWRIERYVEEVETVRRALGLGKVDLLGHSWGGWLAIEYALTHPEALRTLILENTCGDIPHLTQELNRLREALGPETVAMMQRHEALGTLDHPEYQAAITLLNYRHVCRMDVWPDAVNRSLGDWNMEVYGAMQGPNEFLYVGNLKDWRRIEEMPRIACPVLITTGLHDEIGPPCAMRMAHALPDARVEVFRNSSHMPFHEEPEPYFAALRRFLDETA
ncbi:MAG: proline iminopeptidase-family hydrolase [Paracoccaceae bacterium]